MSEFERQKKIQFNQQLYTFALCLLAFKGYVMDSSMLFQFPDFCDLLFKVVFLVCMFWKLSSQNYNIKHAILFLVLGPLCLYTCIRINNFYLLFSFFGIAAAQDIDIKKVVEKTAMLQTWIIAFHVVIYIFNLVVNPSSIVYTIRDDSGKRHFFYLGHANTFSGYVLWTSLEYLYARSDKITKKDLLTVLGVNLFFYFWADSKTCMATAVVVVVLLWINRMQSHILHWVAKFVARFAFAAFSILSATACISYTRLSGPALALFKELNSFFTGRLLFGAYAYDKYGLTMLGRMISFPPKIQWREYWFDGLIFDNAYIWMLVSGGAIYLLILAFALQWIGKRTTYLEDVMLIAYALYGVTEAYIMNVGNCFPLLFIGLYLYHKKEETAIKEQPERERGLTAYEKIKYIDTGI